MEMTRDGVTHQWFARINVEAKMLITCYLCYGTPFPFRWYMYLLCSNEYSVEQLINLPWHWGCTYSKIIFQDEAYKKYDFQKNVAQEYYKIGADYCHLHDDILEHTSPSHGIPHEIISDYEEVVKAFLKLKKEIKNGK